MFRINYHKTKKILKELLQVGKIKKYTPWSSVSKWVARNPMKASHLTPATPHHLCLTVWDITGLTEERILRGNLEDNHQQLNSGQGNLQPGLLFQGHGVGIPSGPELKKSEHWGGTLKNMGIPEITGLPQDQTCLRTLNPEHAKLRRTKDNWRYF